MKSFLKTLMVTLVTLPVMYAIGAVFGYLIKTKGLDLVQNIVAYGVSVFIIMIAIAARSKKKEGENDLE